jgi:hypothetical protein
VLLLGSGELGKEVAIELQRLGCEVIAADRYADAPAMQVAHRSHVLAMTDAAALRALVVAERPHLIVPEIEAIATDELVRIEAEGLATVIPTARAAQLRCAPRSLPCPAQCVRRHASLTQRRPPPAGGRQAAPRPRAGGPHRQAAPPAPPAPPSKSARPLRSLPFALIVCAPPQCE